MAYDETLAERIRTIIAGRSGVTERKMFGGLAFMAGGNMFCGVINRDLMARVGALAYETSLARPSVRLMDFAGKPMTGMVYVGSSGTDSDADLKAWVDQCYEFAASLPAKLPARTKASRGK